MSVGMLILGLIMAALLASFSTASRASVTSDYRIQNLEEGRLLMENITKDLRTAAPPSQGLSPFFPHPVQAGKVHATDREVSFYAELGTTGAPKRVRLWLDTTNANEPVLREYVTPPDSEVPPLTYTASNEKNRLVGRYIINAAVVSWPADASNAVFQYEDSAGSPLGPLPLTTAQALLVRSITIRLKVRKSTSLSVAATTLENRVRLPNVIYSLQAGSAS
jgi:hypothetical protein